MMMFVMVIITLCEAVVNKSLNNERNSLPAKEKKRHFRELAHVV